MDRLHAAIEELLGPDGRPAELTLGQMALRALIVYVVALVLIRTGGKRMLGRNSAFDLVVAIVLGSTISRGVNGSAPFGETLGAAVAVVAAHWLTAYLSVRSRAFRRITESHPQTMYEKGAFRRRAMARARVTEDDLEMAAREENLAQLSDAERVVLECNGRFSVLPKDDSD